MVGFLTHHQPVFHIRYLYSLRLLAVSFLRFLGWIYFLKTFMVLLHLSPDLDKSILNTSTEKVFLEPFRGGAAGLFWILLVNQHPLKLNVADSYAFSFITFLW